MALERRAGLELPHGQVSSGHAEDGRSSAERCHGADCYIKTRTDDAHCDRFGSIKCETWTDVAQCADMKVAGTDDAGYMPIHGKCLVELNTKKLNYVRKQEAGASHLNTSGSVRTSQSACCQSAALKAKFHYASWFEAGSKLVADRFEARSKPVADLQRAEICPII